MFLINKQGIKKRRTFCWIWMGS